MATGETATAKTGSTLTITDAASAKIKALLSEEEDQNQALRIAVTGGGCSGFQYAMGFDNEQHDDDVVIEHDGVRVFVDEMSLNYLGGAQVDYQDGLSGKGFSIENPNATGTCGCGSSFTC